MLTALSQTACITTLPDFGQGGLAERSPNNYRTVNANEPLGPEHGLRFELELVSRHLDILILEGAELCFPATVVQAKHREIRITRQLDGNLDYAAASDLLIQRQLLMRLEHQLDYVKQQAVCEIPLANTHNQFDGHGNHDDHQRTEDLFSHLSDLLNADNQFAHDSAEINPKYIARLAQAAQILIKNKDITLQVTGYADDTGNNEYNQRLSKQRAQKVARYLKLLGINASRLSINAVGETQAPYEGTEPQVRLVNRTVKIELSDSIATNVASKPNVFQQIK